MSIKGRQLFPGDSSLKVKLRKVYDYLFQSFPFDAGTINYDEYWDRLSKENRPVSSFKLNLIAGIIDNGSSVLDIGCGDGNLLQYLNGEKGTEGHGIDISEKAVELAKEKGVRAEVADITREEFQLAETYDYIIVSEVLEHLSNPEQLMLKLKDKFSKYLLITIPNTGFVADRLRLLLGKFSKQWVLHPSEHLRFWTVTDFKFWCQQLGFEVESYYGEFDEYYDIKIKLWKYYPKLFSRFILYKVIE